MTIFYRGTAGHNRIEADNVSPYSDTIRIEGLTGNDNLVGGALHNNEIFGGTGDDTLQGGGHLNLLDGGDGNDELNAWVGEYNTMRGGNGKDHLTGGDNGNLLDGGSGADTLIGGEGLDIYVVDTTLDVIHESYVPYFENDPRPRDQVQSHVSWILRDHLEDLKLLGSGTINGTGNKLSNTIIGNARNNILTGEGGADTLEGGLGNDLIEGGAGNDTIRFSGVDSVKLSLSSGSAQATGFGSDTVKNIENAVTSGGNDYVKGSSAANTINTGAGNDQQLGMAGNDRLFGAAGNDRLSGGAGDDQLFGGAGADRFIFASGDGKDRISDFVNGQDRIFIDSGADRFVDLRVTDLGADARVTFGNVVITLTNFDRAQLGAEDFTFV